ncbi:hypothetical protein [Allofranklinella schreckenbergeri]|uniref:hypothetical protein n=1 Tax=Allofranklinella schreckenbergeri TaxID=1076744 RepID=UPI001EEECD71|nr:hypothetical protein [Allofranklinella schreckenbergeri]
MPKPATLGGYSDRYTVDCERVLVTLLRGLGPWKESVYLIGGLVPRYLVAARPPAVPAHAGTLDVDIVIDLHILADTEAYHTLEDNLRKMGFERAENAAGQKLSWRWQTRTEHGALMVLELLTDAPHLSGGKVRPLPTEGAISALNIPHASIVFDLHQVTEIQAELLGGNGIASEKVRHANLVSFTCLKAFAFEQRFARKDAHDLVYCLEHAPRRHGRRGPGLSQRTRRPAPRRHRRCAGRPAPTLCKRRNRRGLPQGWPGIGRQIRAGRRPCARTARSPGAAAAASQRGDRATAGPAWVKADRMPAAFDAIEAAAREALSTPALPRAAPVFTSPALQSSIKR